MRKILRNMAKAKMKEMGVDKINKRMRGNWRRVINAYPTDIMTGEKMRDGYHGRKKYRPVSYTNHLFHYNWKFQPIPESKKNKRLKRA